MSWPFVAVLVKEAKPGEHWLNIHSRWKVTIMKEKKWVKSIYSFSLCTYICTLTRSAILTCFSRNKSFHKGTFEIYQYSLKMKNISLDMYWIVALESWNVAGTHPRNSRNTLMRKCRAKQYQVDIVGFRLFWNASKWSLFAALYIITALFLFIS